MKQKTPFRLATLGHPQRLAIFRLLMRRYPDSVPAGEIADALDIKASTLSAYLSALMEARLVQQDRAGTSLLYSIDMAEVRLTFDYLLFDCCRGRPELCRSAFLGATKGKIPMREGTCKVLFISHGNSARSIFAESILRREAGDRFTVYSAGTKPNSDLNPVALEVLKQRGHDVSGLRAKNVAEFQRPDAPEFDFVFTVCNRAANEECPAWQGQPVSAHWGVPDPVEAEGTDAEKNIAFQWAYESLSNRIRAFAALPIASLDRISLQKAVDDLAHESAVEAA